MLSVLTSGGESLPVSGAIFLASAAVVWWAGARLAGYADRFARATGLGGAVVGLVVLGGVTSLPEIATSATAAASGAADLAVNNLIGGVALQLVVLAVIDMLVGREALTANLPRPDVLAYAAMNIALLVVIAAVVAAGDLELFSSGFGLGSVLVALAYAGCLFAAREIDRNTRWRPVSPLAAEQVENVGDVPDRQEPAAPGDSKARLGLLIAGVGAVILVAGFLLTRSGEALAEQTGLGSAFFGAVFLAGATSLPELSSAIAAVRLKRAQMAIGDVLGGNLFNLALLLLIDAVYRGGPVLGVVGAFSIVASALGALLSAVFIIGMVERRDRTVLRMGWDSAAVLLIYLGALPVLYALRGQGG